MAGASYYLLAVLASASAASLMMPVTAQAQTAQAVIEAKRNTATVLGAISAERLDKFPDRIVAMALGNIPGVTAERARREEERRVAVPGLGEEFVTTTLNGPILPTRSSKRSFAFDVLSRDIISDAQVLEAIQPWSLASRIGGNIDLRTVRPLDKRGLRLSNPIERQHNDLADKGVYKNTLVVSTTFAGDAMGVLMSATYGEYKSRTNNQSKYFPRSDTKKGQQSDMSSSAAIDEDAREVALIAYPSVIEDARNEVLSSKICSLAVKL